MGNGSTCEISSSCQQSAWAPIDCGKLTLCTGPGDDVCTCTATSCSVPLGNGDITFDMQLDSGTLSGSETGIGPGGVDDSELLDVILTKQ
jgi:hypothetical protein